MAKNYPMMSLTKNLKPKKFFIVDLPHLLRVESLCSVIGRGIAELQSDSLLSGSHGLNPLMPAPATVMAGNFLAITCQQLELESCSNPLRIWGVF